MSQPRSTSNQKFILLTTNRGLWANDLFQYTFICIYVSQTLDETIGRHVKVIYPIF